MGHLRSITVAALAVVGTCAWAAGLALLLDPSGGSLGLTAEGLPLVRNYLLPALVLIALLGVLPVVAVLLLRRRSAGGWTATTTVGVLAVLWSLGQVVVLGVPSPIAQAGFLLLGVLLTGLGLDGGMNLGARDEFRRAVRSSPHANERSRPRPPDRRGDPRGDRRPERPADRSHPV